MKEIKSPNDFTFAKLNTNQKRNIIIILNNANYKNNI